MITSGIIIGKVIDDLASLKYQIETRNKKMGKYSNGSRKVWGNVVIDYLNTNI